MEEEEEGEESKNKKYMEAKYFPPFLVIIRMTLQISKKRAAAETKLCRKCWGADEKQIPIKMHAAFCTFEIRRRRPLHFYNFRLSANSVEVEEKQA